MKLFDDCGARVIISKLVGVMACTRVVHISHAELREWVDDRFHAEFREYVGQVLEMRRALGEMMLGGWDERNWLSVLDMCERSVQCMFVDVSAALVMTRDTYRVFHHFKGEGARWSATLSLWTHRPSFEAGLEVACRDCRRRLVLRDLLEFDIMAPLPPRRDRRWLSRNFNRNEFSKFWWDVGADRTLWAKWAKDAFLGFSFSYQSSIFEGQARTIPIILAKFARDGPDRLPIESKHFASELPDEHVFTHPFLLVLRESRRWIFHKNTSPRAAFRLAQAARHALRSPHFRRGRITKRI